MNAADDGNEDRAPRIAVVGAGILGVRIVRELLTQGPDGRTATSGVMVVTRSRERRDQLRASFGSQVDVRLERADTPTRDLFDGVSVVVVAREVG